MRRSRVLPRLVASCALVMVLAGCGSRSPKPAPLVAEPASQPSSRQASQSATPQAPASPAAPTMPTAAKGTSEAAAKAFVNHYLDVLSYAARTGDTASMSHLSDPTCYICIVLTSRIENAYATGGLVSGHGYAATHLTVERQPHRPRRSLVHATVMLPQTGRTDHSATAPGRRVARSEFRLASADGGWRLLDWVRL